VRPLALQPPSSAPPLQQRRISFSKLAIDPPPNSPSDSEVESPLVLIKKSVAESSLYSSPLRLDQGR
jgi:hypothetical protein